MDEKLLNMKQMLSSKSKDHQLHSMLAWHSIRQASWVKTFGTKVDKNPETPPLTKHFKGEQAVLPEVQSLQVSLLKLLVNQSDIMQHELK